MKKKENSISEKQRQLKKEFRQSVFIIVVVLCVMVATTIAWFVNNTTVTAGLVELRSDYTAPFEIRSVINNELLSEQETDTDKTKIEWTLTEDIYKEDTDEEKNFIGPGASGKVVFDIVNFDEDLDKVEFTLDLSAVTEAGDVIENDIKQDLLEGHLLLFLQEDRDYDFKNHIIPNSGEPIIITLNQDNHTHQFKRVTIQWVWTNVFANLIRSDAQLGDLFCNAVGASNEIDKRDKFLAYINGGTNHERFKQFFYTDEEWFASNRNNIKKYEEYNTYDKQKELKELEEYFNDADQYIGKSIKELKIEIRVTE